MRGHHNIVGYCEFHVTYLDYVDCLIPYLSYVRYANVVNPSSYSYCSNMGEL